MGEMSGSNSPQWRWEASSLPKDKWRTLWLSLPAPQTQNHRANRRVSFLTPRYARGSSSTAMPAQPRDPMRKTGQKKAPSPGEAILQGKKKTPCPNKTRSKPGQTSTWCSFDLVLSSLLYTLCLWHLGKSVVTWHMPLTWRILCPAPQYLQ